MKKIIFTLLIIHISLIIAYAQWQADIRLRHALGDSYTSYNNAWCIASNGNFVHVVWYDFRQSINGVIYYKRSTDGGVTWGSETALTNSYISGHPSVAVSGSTVHVVWDEFRDLNYEIYYKRSTDGGISWGYDTQLTNNSAESGYPSSAVFGSNVHVVWRDKRDGNYEIYYKRSIDGGSSWGTDTKLSNNSGFSAYPSVAVSGSVVHVVWEDDRVVNYEIYYKRSTDGGITWEADTLLTNYPDPSHTPSVSVSGSIVHVVWVDGRDLNQEIYYKRSTDGGISWETDTRLTFDIAVSNFPSVSVSGLIVHVAWHDVRNGTNNVELYYKRSIDAGVNWEVDTRLTNYLGFSGFPSISVSGIVVHVVWTDQRNGNLEIYYKRNPTGNSTRLVNINSDIPKKYKLEQNYPNPFNPTTKIRFSIPLIDSHLSLSRCNRNGNDNMLLSVYDLLGRHIETLLNESLQPGTYSVVWNASNHASGIYFYTLSAPGYRDTKRMILIK